MRKNVPTRQPNYKLLGTGLTSSIGQGLTPPAIGDADGNRLTRQALAPHWTAVSGSSNQDLKDGWEYATELTSNDPFVLSMGQALGKTDAEMISLFELAKSK